MILAARYSATGMHAGIPVVCRQFQGAHRWLVKLDIVFDDGRREEREITCDQPVPLRLLGPFATKAMQEVFGDGPISVRKATWEAYCLTPKRRVRR